MGVFNSSDVFTTYRLRLRFRDKLMGGTPKDPKIITGWLRSKAGVTNENEIRNMMLRTLMELGADVKPGMDYDELVEASEALASNQATGFKRDDAGLYIESRQVKAMLKECTNILFAGVRWGKTKKGPKAFVAERVFVNPDRIHLGADEPDGVDLLTAHLSGPQGKQSVLKQYEYVQGTEIEFEVMVAEDAISQDNWAQVWILAQENGLGALRSQGHGRFDVEQWERAK